MLKYPPVLISTFSDQNLGLHRNRCSNETGPFVPTQGKALNLEYNSKEQVFNCSLTYRYVNLKCFYTSHIKKVTEV